MSTQESRPNPLMVATPSGDLEERWWDDPAIPDARLPLARMGLLIPQILEERGKRSCALTSQLNAWILRGSLTTEEAEAVQITVATDPAYASYWRHQGRFGKDYYAWHHLASSTAHAVRAITGHRMSMHVAQARELPKILRDGYASTLALEGHTRVAFMPAGSGESEVAVYDPKYSDQTGIYEFEAAVGLHSPNRTLFSV